MICVGFLPLWGSGIGNLGGYDLRGGVWIEKPTENGYPGRSGIGIFDKNGLRWDAGKGGLGGDGVL